VEVKIRKEEKKKKKEKKKKLPRSRNSQRWRGILHSSFYLFSVPRQKQDSDAKIKSKNNKKPGTSGSAVSRPSMPIPTPSSYTRIAAKNGKKSGVKNGVTFATKSASFLENSVFEC
jgi:hypothetical protein